MFLVPIYVFERQFDGDNRTNTILSPLMDCHDPGRIVSGKPNIHSSSFDNVLFDLILYVRPINNLSVM